MSFVSFSRLLLLSLLSTTLLSAHANNVTLGQPSTTAQNTVSGTTQIQVDVSWENSWLDTENHDAVWLFAKYRVAGEGGDQVWRHATLADTGHTAPPVLQVIQPNNKGLLVKRATQGTGNITSSTVQLRWQYSADPKSASPAQFVGNSDPVELQVYAVEMVYVPQGSFYVGDGKTAINTSFGHFRRAETDNEPFQITSANAITLGGTTPGDLSTTRSSSYDPEDDFNAATTRLLPETYPNGFNAFYLMKYEITQEQYVAFLNSLTRQQQAARVASDISGETVTNTYVLTNTPVRATERNGVRAPQSIGTAPIAFYCDLDGDGTANEANDGQTIACNYLSTEDVAAYLDWAALRPMTELEYEKACRGPLPPTAGEFAWGNNSFVTLNNLNLLSAPGTAAETCTDPTRNVVRIATNTTSAYVPVRVGIFATATSDRVQSGAGYYGAMNLSGNVSELVIPLGNPSGRSYSGAQGDGALSASGNADVSGWPAGSTAGLGRRALYISIPETSTVSSRIVINSHANTGRTSYSGGRGALNPQEID